jgi:hypothetical protein
MSWRLKRINAPQRHDFDASLSGAGAHDKFPEYDSIMLGDGKLLVS